jgi:hypothetical protein
MQQMGRLDINQQRPAIISNEVAWVVHQRAPRINFDVRGRRRPTADQMDLKAATGEKRQRFAADETCTAGYDDPFHRPALYGKSDEIGDHCAALENYHGFLRADDCKYRL